MQKSNSIWLLYQIVLMLTACTHGENRKSECPGPSAYYEALGCKPVVKNIGKDKCPYNYECDSLKSRSPEKCYANGKEYSIGQKLRKEDANPAKFNCAAVDCPNPKPFRADLICYQRKNPLECCPGNNVCVRRPEDRPTCIVNGKIYKDGERFELDSDPAKSCICGPGYKGENVEPFCASPKRTYCDPYFRDPKSVVENCAPVYYSNQSPQKDCNLSTRCQNERDKIIRHKKSKGETSESTCKFGSLVLSVGDELNRATDYSSVCVKCVCEVGPVLTCQRLPDDECDVTKHPPFK